MQTEAFYTPRSVRAGTMRNAFILLILLGLVLRIAFRFIFADLESPVLWEFSKIARVLLNTGEFAMVPGSPTAFMPPFYPLLLAGLYKLFRIGYEAHLALAVILWFAEFTIPFLIGYIAERIWNVRVAQIAFLLALFWPFLLLTSGTLLNVPFYFMPLIAIALMLSDLPLWKRILYMGLVMGILWNIRFETPLLMLPFAYYLFFFDRDRDTGELPPLLTRVMAVSALALIFIACISPWVARNTVVYGKPLLSTEGGYHMHRGHHDNATGTGRDLWPADKGTDIVLSDEVKRTLAKNFRTPEGHLLTHAYHKSEVIKWIKENPAQEARLIANKIFYFVVTDFTHPVARIWYIWIPSFVALLVGFYFWARTGLRDPRQQMLWMFFGIQFALCVAFVVLPRNRIAVEYVPLMFFAAWLAYGRFGQWYAEHVSA